MPDFAREWQGEAPRRAIFSGCVEWHNVLARSGETAR